MSVLKLMSRRQNSMSALKTINLRRFQSTKSAALKLKVLISGGGIAGPCLAYWLSQTRHDVSITVVERSPKPRVTGQAIDIRGPAIEIVKKMKLEEAIRSRFTTEEGTRFLGSSGKSFAQFSAKDGDGHTFTAEYEILRADLSELFLEATEGTDNIKYVYGDSIKALEQTEKDVKVSFAKGSEDSFDLVVAADGGTSTTRPLILDEHVLKNSYRFIGQYLAFFSIPSRKSDEKYWYWYNAPKGLGLMTRPHRNPSTLGAYLCLTTPARGRRDPVVEEAMNQGTAATKQMLHTYFENAGWEAKRILDGMDQADDFYMTKAAQVKLPKWTNNRALVIGDAAFATFGIGTSLAIQSAYFLAGEISKIRSSDEVPKAVARYEEVFRPLYTKMEELPPGFPQLAFPQTKVGLWIRDRLLWLVSKTKLYRLFQGGSEAKSELPIYDWVESTEGK